jgi:bifunctional non-homologous end joining protein LigD
VVAAPDGIGGPVTYVRHEGHWQGPLRTSPVITHMTAPEKGKTYPVFDSVQALVVAADLGIVELHPWNSVPGDPGLPGRMVFDLDPDEGQSFADVAHAADELETRLLGLGLLSFVKTSGRRGLHVVVPFDQPKVEPASWAEVRGLALQVCRDMAADSPGRYTTALPKAERRGRLFLDYLRNDPGHHAASLLSPRTTPEATVSMPIDWKALREPIDPRGYTVRDAPKRLRESNPWTLYEAAARPIRYARDRAGRRRR